MIMSRAPFYKKGVALCLVRCRLSSWLWSVTKPMKRPAPTNPSGPNETLWTLHCREKYHTSSYRIFFKYFSLIRAVKQQFIVIKQQKQSRQVHIIQLKAVWNRDPDLASKGFAKYNTSRQPSSDVVHAEQPLEQLRYFSEL